MADTKDPFYVGYLPLPTALRTLVKVFIGGGIVGAIALAFVLASRQQDPGPGKSSGSQTLAIEGHLSVEPYPIVFVEDPQSATGVRAVLLVSNFKFGAAERAAALGGKRVRAQGHFVTREGRGVFQLVDGEGALTAIDDTSTPPKIEELGEHTLIGEITDAKCFFGTMKPGFGKTHRACAVRCISGGVPRRNRR